MDSEDQRIRDSVLRNGWHAISVADRPPAFVYTCGLQTTFGHPELILFGLEEKLAYDILSTMVGAMRKGHKYGPGIHRGIIEGDTPLLLAQVHASQHEIYLGYALGHCRVMGKTGSLVALQILWPDKESRFPTTENCDLMVRRGQPLLNRPTD